MTNHLDLDRVKSTADLPAICGYDTQLKRVASTNGGEYAGACPFCGGRDRFRMQPNAKPYPLWMCRQCGGGVWDTVIGYIARRDNLDPKKRDDLAEICRRAVGDIPTTNTPRPAPPPVPAYAPHLPQEAAHQVINECEAALWQPKYSKVLDYLRGRGLWDETIKRFRLGYCGTGKADQYGKEIAGLYVPRGIVIPCIVAGVVWYLKIRLVPGVPCKCSTKESDTNYCGTILPTPGKCPKCGEDNRYRGVSGNRPAAIYNADSLAGADMALFCEGEFDCMIAAQELGGIMPAVTIGGSATNRLDLATWGAYLLPLRSILAAYDSDKPGQAGAGRLADLSNRVRLAAIPERYKDLNDWHLAGGDLLDWAAELKAFYSDPQFAGV